MSIVRPPLIAHIIYRLGIGGLENGLVNLINHLPEERFRHVIICLKDATDFRQRIRHSDVPVYCLNRREGHDFGMFIRLYRLLRELKPDIVHTRNLAALECQLPAWLAGVAGRVHGEHGWDVFDPEGASRKYQWLRRLYRPLVQRYIALSGHLERYLLDKVGVPAVKLVRICNGVNTEVFYPAKQVKSAIPDCPFTNSSELFLIGTVGRMHGVKDQLTLVRSLLRLLEIRPQARECARLILVGEGPLRGEARQVLAAAGVEQLAWLPGERSDIAEIMRGLDLFVLPSQAEGISNTILEAMATGLPVVATAVGGNPELVVDGQTGRLVPSNDAEVMARALAEYLDRPDQTRLHGEAGLRRVHEQFSLDNMVGRYLAVYDDLLGKSARTAACAAS